MIKKRKLIFNNKRESLLNIMKMKIFQNEYGMTFYNEIIFKFYKFQFNQMNHVVNQAFMNGKQKVKSSE